MTERVIYWDNKHTWRDWATVTSAKPAEVVPTNDDLVRATASFPGWSLNLLDKGFVLTDWVEPGTLCRIKLRQ